MTRAAADSARCGCGKSGIGSEMVRSIFGLAAFRAAALEDQRIIGEKRYSRTLVASNQRCVKGIDRRCGGLSSGFDSRRRSLRRARRVMGGSGNRNERDQQAPNNPFSTFVHSQSPFAQPSARLLQYSRYALACPIPHDTRIDTHAGGVPMEMLGKQLADLTAFFAAHWRA